ncbi:hypothetical protein HDV00_006231 [Rhizophlyctis rosea]|nr:hypothetical protein HDV00_006231 [Rhizophlyctis rosea]
MADVDEAHARKQALHPFLSSYIGKHRSTLPTPSVCVSLPTIQRNCDIFLKSLEGTNFDFRAHVKTHKTPEVTKLMLGGRYRSVITSTVREIRGLRPLIDDGAVTDVLFGLPPAVSYIPVLSSLSSQIPNLRLLVDHPSQLSSLNSHPPASGKPWSVFVKLDGGYHRAGVEPTSGALQELLIAALGSTNISIYGFYVHAGDSYSSKSETDSVAYLQQELKTVVDAVNVLRTLDIPVEPDTFQKLVLSIGATPTAHVAAHLKHDPVILPKNCELEFHAGNFPFNDLQQLATGVVPPPPQKGGSSLACTVNVEVLSIYPTRNEALVNAGVLALGREPGQFPGFARVRGKENWIVGQVSQEHGIMRMVTDGHDSTESDRVEDTFAIGDKLVLDVQHSCVAAAGHDWYFVLDDDEVVVDVWYPWRSWM